MEQLKCTHCIQSKWSAKMLHLLFIAHSVAPPEGHRSAGFRGDCSSNIWTRKAINSVEEGIMSPASCFAKAVLMEPGALADHGVLGLPPSLRIWPACKSDPVWETASESTSGVGRLRTSTTGLSSMCHCTPCAWSLLFSEKPRGLKATREALTYPN